MYTYIDIYHEVQSLKQYRVLIMPTKFYDTPAWKKLRRLRLMREPLCRHCMARGRVVAATQVDHVKPISQGGPPMDIDNTQSLCISCHSIKTSSDKTGKLIKGCDDNGMPFDVNHPWHGGGGQ